MRIIDRVRKFVKDLTEFQASTSDQKPQRESILYRPPVLPEGTSETYGIQLEDDGKYVITVNGIATMAPRWSNPEEARRDAWERQWADERGAIALAEYEARERDQ